MLYRFIFLLLITQQSFATTWDEPWRNEILQKAEHWVLGEIIESSDSNVIIRVIKDVDGQLEGELTIDGFYMLDLCSVSAGHGPEFHFLVDEQCYFFLKKGKNGNYQLPTPTSGFDQIVDDLVHATYRHSYHQAAVSPTVYELTMGAIWKHYQKTDYNKEALMAFISEQLNQAPAMITDAEDDLTRFFEQHAALESAYLLKIPLDFSVLEKFIVSDNFHAQVSALRALRLLRTEEAKAAFKTYIKKRSNADFSKVIAIWGLWTIGDEKDRKWLWRIRKRFPKDEEGGFGGNIMDPRVCTAFPNSRNAVLYLKRTPNDAQLP